MRHRHYRRAWDSPTRVWIPFADHMGRKLDRVHHGRCPPMHVPEVHVHLRWGVLHPGGHNRHRHVGD